jgi:hypothetical protein
MSEGIIHASPDEVDSYAESLVQGSTYGTYMRLPGAAHTRTEKTTVIVIDLNCTDWMHS